MIFRGDAVSCDEAAASPIAGEDAYDRALARARCEHPDMLVNPNGYVLRRVPGAPNVSRFVLDRTGETMCCYEVLANGNVVFRP